MYAPRAVAACVAALITFAAVSATGSLEPAEPNAATSAKVFAADVVRRGASLAAIGNCSGCHSVADEPPYSGGVAVKTPFGVVFGSNITPDMETGIGAWPVAAFNRAMQEGVARDGRDLYPAFPYDHFTYLVQADLDALYAFLMTRTAVSKPTPSPRLSFPFNLRPLLKIWKLLYFERGPYRPDPARDAEWNRGAYLTSALAHCSACHSPRNMLGAERRDKPFAGGVAEGWYAPPLNADSPSPQPWTLERLTEFLRTGIAQDHAMAGGPMQQVVANLANADSADVRAIAVYTLSLMEPMDPVRKARALASKGRADRPLPLSSPQVRAEAGLQIGATVYANACASCHDAGRGMSSDAALQLPLAASLYDIDPRSFLRIVRGGIIPRDGEAGRWMPPFGDSLTDKQLFALAAFLRHEAAGLSPWPNLEKAILESKK